MIQKLRYAVLLLVLTSLTACTSSPDQSTGNSLPEGYSNAGTLELEQSLRIGEETGTIFGGVGGVVANEDGQIFVSDYENTHIRVFSQEGDSLMTFGRKGEGPGEFTVVYDLFVTDRGLVAFDTRQDRFSIFSIDRPYDFISTHTLSSPEGYYPAGPVGRSGSRFLVNYSKPFRNVDRNGVNLGPDAHLAWVDSTGENVKDSVLMVPGIQVLMRQEGTKRMYANMPFARGPRFAAGQSGSIYYGRTDSLRIEHYSSTGEHLSRVRFPYDYVPVSETELDSLMSDRSEWARKALLSSDAVSTRPAFDDLLTDDRGRLWIDVTDDPSNNTTPWKIVNFDKKTVREVVLPENVSIETIRDGKVYGIHTDEYGVDEVVVYRINSVPA